MHIPPRIRVGVVGAHGFAGAELIRLLARHPIADLRYLAVSRETDVPLADTYPHLSWLSLPDVQAFQVDSCIEACDTAFVALPSGASGAVAAKLWERGIHVIDLSGDLRLPADVYTAWYAHGAVEPSIQSQAVYGLSEWYRQDVAKATLVSNPGCYATAVLLGLLPVVRHRLWDGTTPIVVDAKSGISGAGKTPTRSTHLAELSDNFCAYKIGRHQHIPEIENVLGAHTHSKLVLTTQLLPVIRGIFATCYIKLAEGAEWAEIEQAFADAYEDTPFVRMTMRGHFPELKHVRGSNQCRIGLHLDERTGMLQVFSVLDNLQKGAAGQAVQNFNLMHGLPEGDGLAALPLYP